MSNKLEHYLKLPYTTIIRPCEDGIYEASVAELEGCLSHGKTKEEALEMIEDAKRAWIETNLEAGDTIPEPDSSYLEEVIRLYDIHLRKAVPE
ncbi:MAG: type II toxin-antitoxin system HicB family antitoxin [bacterium]